MAPDEQYAIVTFVNPVWTVWAVNIGSQFNLKTSERLVLERIAQHVRSEHDVGGSAYCWPWIDTIAALCGLSNEVVNRAIRRFKDIGILSREAYREPGGNRHARAIRLFREPLREPVARDRLPKLKSRMEPVSGDSFDLPPVTDANPRQRQLHIDNTMENHESKTSRTPLAAKRGGARQVPDQQKAERIRKRMEAIGALNAAKPAQGMTP